MRFFNIIVLCFVLLCGCRSIGRVTKENFSSVWFPPATEGMYAERDIRSLTDWDRCGSGYYIGFSIYNMDGRKLQTCKQIGNGNTMCAYYYNYELDDGGGNNIPWIAVFNIKYNAQKVVWGCDAERMMGYAY